jgi:membrane associated rhomboid family serine protease
MTAVAAAILWAVYLVAIFLPAQLQYYGLRPREFEGIWGIVFAPFLHMNFRHLIANSGALFVLLTVSVSYDRKLTILAVIISGIVGGGLVWLFGTGSSIHIGCSGILFGLMGFLLFNGIFRKEWPALLISASVFILYGSALLSLFYYVPGISWSGHFFSFIAGILAAWWTKAIRRGKKSFVLTSLR